jgi:SOS response regulatory protein OraA/RecX
MSFGFRQRDTPPEEPALQMALKMLGRRALSRRELLQKLARKGYPPSDCETALAAMVDYGYIDDTALAQACSGQANTSGRGPMWVRQKLAQRQVDQDTAAQAAHTTYASEAEATVRALAVLKRRFANAPVPKDRLAAQKQSQRALRFLLGRGFSFGSAREALQQLGAAEPLPDTQGSGLSPDLFEEA